MDSKNSNKTIYSRLIGEVNDKTVGEVIHDIDKAHTSINCGNIVITIESTGGLLYPAFALYNHISASKIPVTVVASGTCMSSALMILQSAQKRISRPNTVFMMHQSNYWRDQHTYYDEMKVITSEWDRLYKEFVSLTIKKSDISLAQFEDIAKPRKYFLPDEALKLNLIDEVSDKWVE
jgi:ATP-dependent protease ClpP protease subunit